MAPISTAIDVYVSFRSTDTRKIFVDPLCTALNLDEIQTYFYDSELQGGEEVSSLVSAAIEVSNIIIVVLSTNYASSSWCLDELVEILKSKKGIETQKVFPIFYQVDPEDVRQLSGAFGTAFRKHADMKDLKEVETWKAALAAIGCLSGKDNSVFLPSRTELQKDFPERDGTLFDIKGLHGPKETVKPHTKVLAAGNLKEMHIRNSKLHDIQDNLSFRDLERLFIRFNLDLTCIPMSFFERMPALKVLDMSYTGLRTLPPSVSKLIKLEELILECCELLMELPDEIISLGNLKVLDLNGCTTLDEKLNSFKLPRNLSILDLANCTSLTKLPESISKLGSLEYLNLSGCTNLAEISESIDFPQSLSFLDVSDCQNLTKLPESITRLRFFNHLYLSGCTNLADIPDFISFPQSVSSLHLTNCRSLTKLPESISRLRSLENLNLSGCTNLAEISESIHFSQSLCSLDLRDCKSLTKLPKSLSKLKSLKYLFLSGCTNLVEILESVGFPQKITLLDLTDCKSLKKLPESTRKLRSLWKLSLRGCSSLLEVPISFFARMSALKVLDMSSTSVRTLPSSVFKLHKLEKLLLRHCELLMELPHEISALENLKNLDLMGCTNLADIPESIYFLQRLCSLNLRNCRSLSRLPQSISMLRSLKYLYLSGCTNLAEIFESINFPENLCSLYLRGCKSLTKLPEGKSKPTSLQKLVLSGCSSLLDVPTLFFVQFPVLRSLDMSSTSIKTLPHSVSKLTKLEELLLRHCELLKELPNEIGELENLKVLDLEGTDLVCLPEELGELSNLRCLKASLYDAVSYKKSRNIIHIIPRRKLLKLTQLEKLSISVDPHDIWCKSAVEAIIEDLPSLRKLKSLNLYMPTTVLLQKLLELKWNKDDLSIYQNLSNFSFTIGPQAQRFIPRLPCDLEEEFLKLKRCLKFNNGKDDTTTFSEALKHAKALYMDCHWTIKTLSVFEVEKLNALEFCLLVDCNEMQTVFDESAINYGLSSKGDNFHSLQYLAIHYLKKLEEIWRGPGVYCFLQSIKVLVVKMCPKLKTIFPQVLLGDLVNLEEIRIEDCAQIKTVIDADLSLPRLKKLSLLYLPELVSISSGLSIGPKLQNIVIYDCPKLRRLPCMEECSAKVVEIKGESEWWNALEWSSGQPYSFSELDMNGDLVDELAPQYGNSLRLSMKEFSSD
ncbi:uncharacterized protein LOC141667633 [Apium graveolens]|uniref:uncharacterized protein LOC141667633 n=1 Tax=Apium graveolens TaxID=4045 RepID=UPI003D7B4A0D